MSDKTPKVYDDPFDHLKASAKDKLTRLRVPNVESKPQSVFVVMAIESVPGKDIAVAPELGFDCYAVANTYATAAAIIKKDVSRGDLVSEPKAYIVEYPIETPETI